MNYTVRVKQQLDGAMVLRTFQVQGPIRARKCDCEAIELASFEVGRNGFLWECR